MGIKDVAISKQRPGLESLNSHGRKEDKANVDPALKKACQDFESIFVTKMLENMRATLSEEDNLMGKGLGGSIYRDLFDQEIAKQISSGKGLGLADKLYKHMEKIAVNKTRENKPSLSVPLMNTKPSASKMESYHEIIVKAGERYQIEPALIYAVVETESAGDPRAVSRKGAKGLMQLMDGTADSLGVENSLNPDENIAGGTKYLRYLMDRFDGDLKKSLAAYNAGPGNVEKYGGIPPFKETENYVEKVLGKYEYYRSNLSSKKQVKGNDS